MPEKPQARSVASSVASTCAGVGKRLAGIQRGEPAEDRLGGAAMQLLMGDGAGQRLVRAAPALDDQPRRADAPDQRGEAAIGAEMADGFLRHGGIIAAAGGTMPLPVAPCSSAMPTVGDAREEARRSPRRLLRRLRAVEHRSGPRSADRITRRSAPACRLSSRRRTSIMLQCSNKGGRAHEPQGQGGRGHRFHQRHRPRHCAGAGRGGRRPHAERLRRPGGDRAGTRAGWRRSSAFASPTARPTCPSRTRSPA